MNLKLWHVAALVCAGLIAGAIWPGALTQPLRALTLDVFLPALIFEGAWSLDPRVMAQRWTPIALLVLPGVVLTALLVAFAAHRWGGLDLPAALLLGALLAATDPVAVVAIFKRLPVPAALATIVESEALLNDAVAVVLYGAVLSFATGGNGAPLIPAAGWAIAGVFAGIAVGALCALLGTLLLGRSENAWAHGAVAIAGAYGGYFVCARFGWSGIFSVIVCAMVLREGHRRRSAGADAVRSVERVWFALDEGANAILFFLIGAAVELARLGGELRLIGVVLAAVLAARFALAYGLLGLVPRLQHAWKTVVRLAGVRGALSLALALAIPAIPFRTRAIDAAFAVVVVTVVLSALTVERRVAALDLE